MPSGPARETRTFEVEITTDVERPSDVPDAEDLECIIRDGFRVDFTSKEMPRLTAVTAKVKEGGHVASRPIP